MRTLQGKGLLRHASRADEAVLVYDPATGEVLADHPAGRPVRVRSGKPNVVLAVGTQAEIDAERARLEAMVAHRAVAERALTAGAERLLELSDAELGARMRIALRASGAR